MASLEEIFENHITDEKARDEVYRIMYGGRLEWVLIDYFLCVLRPLQLPLQNCQAGDCNAKIAGYAFKRASEQLRAPRIVRIGAIQHKIAIQPDAPVQDQLKAAHKKLGDLIDAAGACGVNVLCLQEAWSKVMRQLTYLLPLDMPFAFCTRERIPWCEFAESAEDGPTTKFLSNVSSAFTSLSIFVVRKEVWNDYHLSHSWTRS